VLLSPLSLRLLRENLLLCREYAARSYLLCRLLLLLLLLWHHDQHLSDQQLRNLGRSARRHVRGTRAEAALRQAVVVEGL
jgi:hypothetical protein